MALTGNEVLQVQGVTSTGLPAGQVFQTTTGAIASLASTEETLTNTPISTVGNGVLTGAGLVGGLIVRSGPVANYTDTTDTASAIIAAIPGAAVSNTFLIRIKNNTAFTQTLSAGSGVTLPSTVLIPPLSIGNYYGTVTSATTITITHFSTTAFTDSIYTTVPALTTLNTVGAGTILASAMVTGYTSRSGAQLSAAFTDTTDTANNIIAASPGLVNRIGAAVNWTYSNVTNAPATIVAGSGCTVSNITVISPNSFADYIITYNAVSTLTFSGVRQGYYPHGGTFASIGTAPVTVSNANVTTYSQISYTLKSVGGTIVGAPVTKTITAGTGFTVSAGTTDLSTYNYNILG